MKRILALILSAILMVSLFAGCAKKEKKPAGTSPETEQTQTEEAFQKPEGYATVVTVTINPEFRLYLDAEGVVLAVESVNADAKKIEGKIEFQDQKIDAVMAELIEAAKEDGFVKENAKIEIKITEIAKDEIDTVAILDTVSTSVKNKLEELSVEAEVNTAVEIESSEEEPETTEPATTTTAPATTTKAPATTTKAPATTTKKPACQHKSTTAKSVSTGNNIIDSSKTDALQHARVCNACGVQVSMENHTVSGSACTACGQNNLAISEKAVMSASIGNDVALSVAAINDDGSLNYDLLVESCWWDASSEGEALDPWTMKIPEAAMLKAIRQKFVMSDAEFEKMKAAGEYHCILGTQTYENGFFICRDPAAGGPGDYSHKTVGYKDVNGKFVVYFDYQEGGVDVQESERIHKYYYAVEYTYSGASNLSVVSKTENEYTSYSIRGWTPVVNSLRIKSIYKVADLSGVTRV